MHKIPVYQPWINGKEREYVNDCIDSSWISSKGEYISRFESAFSVAVGVKYSETVSNGTVALHLCMLALGIGPGDEVLVPTLTYIASVNAIKYVGATPVFVDADPITWQISPSDLELKITEKTKAVIVVHLYGHPSDMTPITETCKRKGIYLVEDCAEALGTYYKGAHVGGFGDMSSFSFFGNKTITTGEGGMVCTGDKTLQNRTRRFKGQGLADYRQYWHDIIGYNYRMTNICAAIGLAQLENLEEILSLKRDLYFQYKDFLMDAPLIVFGEYGEVKSSFWMINIALDNYSERDGLRDY